MSGIENLNFPLAGTLEISLVKTTQVVKLLNQDGSVEECSIREMDGQQRDSYLNKQKQKSKVENGKATVTNFTGLYSELLSYCLYDSDGKQVSEKVIQGYPISAQEALYHAATSINKMNKVGSAATIRNIAAAVESQSDDPALCLSIIKDILRNYDKQVPGSMKENENGDPVPEGEN